jgi:hypothetical protein
MALMKVENFILEIGHVSHHKIDNFLLISKMPTYRVGLFTTLMALINKIKKQY